MKNRFNRYRLKGALCATLALFSQVATHASTGATVASALTNMGIIPPAAQQGKTLSISYIKVLSITNPGEYLTVGNDRKVIVTKEKDKNALFIISSLPNGYVTMTSFANRAHKMRTNKAGTEVRVDEKSGQEGDDTWLLEGPAPATGKAAAGMIIKSVLTGATLRVYNGAVSALGKGLELARFAIEPAQDTQIVGTAISSIFHPTSLPQPVQPTAQPTQPTGLTPTTKPAPTTSPLPVQPVQASLPPASAQQQLQAAIPSSLSDGTKTYPLITGKLPNGLVIYLRSYGPKQGYYLSRPDSLAIQDLRTSSSLQEPGTIVAALTVVHNEKIGGIILREKSLNCTLQAPRILQGTRIGFYNNSSNAEACWALYGTLDQCLLYNVETKKLLTILPDQQGGSYAQALGETTRPFEANALFYIEFASFPQSISKEQSAFISSALLARQQAPFTTAPTTPVATPVATPAPSSVAPMPQTTQVAPMPTPLPAPQETFSAAVMPVQQTPTYPTQQAYGQQQVYGQQQAYGQQQRPVYYPNTRPGTMPQGNAWGQSGPRRYTLPQR